MKFQKYFLFLPTLVLTIFYSSIVFGDILKGRFSDIEFSLNGTVLELKNQVLSFLCTDGKIAHIDWREVSDLTIEDKIYITLGGEEVFFGRFRLSKGRVDLDSHSLGTLSLSVEKISSLQRERLEPHGAWSVSSISPTLQARARGGPQRSNPVSSGSGEEPKEPDKPSGGKKQTSTIGEKPPEAVPEELFLRDQKVLVPRGKGEMEFNLALANKDRSAALLGVDKVRSITPSFTARYGVTERFSSFATLPYVFNWHEVPEGLNYTRTYGNHGLGDLSFGLNYQFMNEGYRNPSLMLTLGVKSNTGRDAFGVNKNEAQLGTGHWEISPGLSLVRTVDPLVLFGSFYYSYNFSKTIDRPEWYETDAQRVESKPGDSLNLILGTGFAVNDKVSLNFKLQGAYVLRDRLEGKGIGETRTPFSFSAGMGYHIRKVGYFEPSVSFGISKDAPDFALSLSYLYKFY